MDMDFQSLANIFIGAVLAVGGWFCKSLFDAVEALKKDVSNLEVSLPKTYILKDDYKSDMSEIKAMLKQIYDKLENKQDKV
jgi:cobalamin biosynthesis Co2+ chelatase CbiK